MLYESNVFILYFQEYCYDSGYDYPGSEISNAVVKSTYLCQVQCQQTSGCQSFTYNTGTKICSTKRGFPTKTKSPGHISGFGKCYDGE